MKFSLESCKYDFSSDNINIITLVYDQSGSMCDDVAAMREANAAFYKDFSKFEESGSIAISKFVFSDYLRMTPFKGVKDFSTDYVANNATFLYLAIREAAARTIDYYNEIVKRLNVRPRITFLVFSDGQDSREYISEYKAAKVAIKELNCMDATTVFVAFREAIYDNTGDKLGFTCTRNITSVRELISCLGNELSKSCKEQSQSTFSLKSQFFSKATDSSEDDSDSETFEDDFFNI